MINRQQSLPSEFVIHIKVIEEKQKAESDTNVSHASPTKTSTIVTKITDPVSSIFDAINSTNRQAKLIFNGQVLCPTLTFAFYNIHNNDVIHIVSSPITASLSSADLIPNIPLKGGSSDRQVLIAAPRPIPISHRTRIESSAKSFRKFGPHYSTTTINAAPNRRIPSQTPPPHKFLIPKPEINKDRKEESILEKEEKSDSDSNNENEEDNGNEKMDSVLTEGVKTPIEVTNS